MKQDFVLGKLAEIVGWGDEEVQAEFDWLRLISRMKYDGYQDFLAGVRFIESLADWLQQFELAERRAAYNFVRRNLVYVSTAEMNHLVELFYPETVEWRILNVVAARMNLPTWAVWQSEDAVRLYERLRRQTLFIELSDGARIDVFRRANVGRVNNEQVVTAPRFNDEKWNDLLQNLRDSLKDRDARFVFVFLIDDFVGSGLTILRKKNGKWGGKLQRFWEDVQKFLPSHFESEWHLCVHHYLATHKASVGVHQKNEEAIKEKGAENWFKHVQFSFGSVLPAEVPLDKSRHADFLRLADKYYDKAIETDHTRLGETDMRRGIAGCGLPLILEHNTPNNSIALLWADTLGGEGQHAMRPLFRRRQRHV